MIRARRSTGYLTTGDVARLTGFSQQHIIRLCEAGILKFFTVPGSKHRRITKPAVVALLKESGVPIPEEVQ